ncbi:hypothetical protein BDV18DRAFT_155922 [Aspergillus unguis]
MPTKNRTPINPPKPSSSASSARWTRSEVNRLVLLREANMDMSWSQFHELGYFPGRSKDALHVRYLRELRERGVDSAVGGSQEIAPGQISDWPTSAIHNAGYTAPDIVLPSQTGSPGNAGEFGQCLASGHGEQDNEGDEDADHESVSDDQPARTAEHDNGDEGISDDGTEADAEHESDNNDEDMDETDTDPDYHVSDSEMEGLDDEDIEADVQHSPVPRRSATSKNENAYPTSSPTPPTPTPKSKHPDMHTSSLAIDPSMSSHQSRRRRTKQKSHPAKRLFRRTTQEEQPVQQQVQSATEPIQPLTQSGLEDAPTLRQTNAQIEQFLQRTMAELANQNVQIQLEINLNEQLTEGNIREAEMIRQNAANIQMRYAALQNSASSAAYLRFVLQTMPEVAEVEFRRMLNEGLLGVWGVWGVSMDLMDTDIALGLGGLRRM